MNNKNRFFLSVFLIFYGHIQMLALPEKGGRISFTEINTNADPIFNPIAPIVNPRYELHPTDQKVRSFVARTDRHVERHRFNVFVAKWAVRGFFTGVGMGALGIFGFVLNHFQSK